MQDSQLSDSAVDVDEYRWRAAEPKPLTRTREEADRIVRHEMFGLDRTARVEGLVQRALDLADDDPEAARAALEEAQAVTEDEKLDPFVRDRLAPHRETIETVRHRLPPARPLVLAGRPQTGLGPPVAPRVQARRRAPRARRSARATRRGPPSGSEDDSDPHRRGRERIR